MRTLRVAIVTATILAAGGIPARAQSSAPPGANQQMSPDDHAVFADALVAGRLAEFKTLLKLSPDQERLWPALESAIRDTVSARIGAARKIMELRRAGDNGRPDPMQRLALAAELSAQRADSLKRILAAAQPFYASLSDDQKHRIMVAQRLRSFRFDIEGHVAEEEGREGDHHWGHQSGDDEHEGWRHFSGRDYDHDEEEGWSGMRPGWGRGEHGDDHEGWRHDMDE
jgi:zinc resistance-associated protein